MLIKLAAFFYKLSLKILAFKLKLERKTIAVGGYKIVYMAKRVKQPRETLIFIHGLNDQKETWLPVVGYLNPNYQTILIDLLGCGESDKPYNFDYSLRSQADFLQKVIKEIQSQESIENFTLLGHSMGGGLALIAAKVLQPKRLVLLAPLAINQHTPYVQEYAKSLGDVKKVPFFHVCSLKRLEELMDLLFYKKPKSPKFILSYIVSKKCAQSKLEEKKILALIDAKSFDFKNDLSDDAKAVTTPTLIVWGDKDKVLHYKNGKELAALIPSSKSITFKECGHMLQLEQPKELALALKDFMKNSFQKP
jgi:abhydrolase domain-containing protein 6